MEIVSSKFINTKTFLYFILFASLVLGCFFRWQRYLNHSVFLEDEGRDFLVARHISHYGEQLKLGHDTTGIPNFYYPNYYYYFLAIITGVIENPYAIYFLFMLASSVSIFLLYLSGKEFFNQETGVYSALFYSLTNVAISASNFWAPYLGLSIFLLALYLFAKFINTKKYIYIYLHILFSALAGIFSFEFVYAIPFFIIWALIIFKTHLKSKNKLLQLITICIWLLFIMITFLPVLIYEGDSIIQMFLQSNSIINLSMLGKNIIGLLPNLAYFIFPKNFQSKILIFPILYLVWLVYIIFRTFFNKTKSLTNFIFLFLFISLGLALSSIKKGEVVWHHTLALMPIIFLLIAYSISKLFSTKLYLRITLVIIFLLVSIDTGYLKHITYSDSIIDTNSLIQNKHIANAIAGDQQDPSTIHVDSFLIYLYYSDENIIIPPQIYYFLEKQVEKKLTYLKDKIWNNFEPIANPDSVKTIYFICRDFADATSAFDSCVHTWITND